MSQEGCQKWVTVERSDEVADEIYRLATDLIEGRRGARARPSVLVNLRTHYVPGDLSNRPGEWLASVAVKPPRKRNRYAVANGATPNGAVQNLLTLVQDIPLVAWD